MAASEHTVVYVNIDRSTFGTLIWHFFHPSTGIRRASFFHFLLFLAFRSSIFSTTFLPRPFYFSYSGKDCKKISISPLILSKFSRHLDVETVGSKNKFVKDSSAAV
jgi:hypothetical protein